MAQWHSVIDGILPNGRGDGIYSIFVLLRISFVAGKYTVLEGVKILYGLNWGVAGRNEEKLRATLKEIGDKVEKDLSNTPIIVADVLDENSLKRMAERAKVGNEC